MLLFDSQTFGLLVTTTGVGAGLSFIALRKNALELKRPRRLCPSCGRRIERRTCGCNR
jgi:hypothetical protein